MQTDIPAGVNDPLVWVGEYPSQLRIDGVQQAEGRTKNGGSLANLFQARATASQLPSSISKGPAVARAVDGQQPSKLLRGVTQQAVKGGGTIITLQAAVNQGTQLLQDASLDVFVG